MPTNSNNIIQKRFREMLIMKGWTYADFIKKNDLQEWEDSIDNVYYGRSKDPRVSTLSVIADALGCGINCLLGKCPHTPQEKAILRNYRECGKHGKSIIELVARYEAGSAKADRDSLEKHKIPCLVPNGDVHRGIIYDTCETIELETSAPEAYVAIKMTNNDLAPKYCKDDVILFENRFPGNGEYAAFFSKDRVYIRKFIEEGGSYRLKCLHNHGEDLILKRMDEVQYIGTCAGVIRT